MREPQRAAELACRVLERLQCTLPVDPLAILGRCPNVEVFADREANGPLPEQLLAGVEATTLRDGDILRVI